MRSTSQACCTVALRLLGGNGILLDNDVGRFIADAEAIGQSLTANCVDQDITTVEGLSTPLQLSPLQAALVRTGGIQCGFCTPGMLVSLTALLQESPRPTGDEIRTAISSNICRCTGYQKIVEAVADMVAVCTA
jgi:aerobic-type carbon monoxide dehydrogenase small subunit (CoxS/CutS family)